MRVRRFLISAVAVVMVAGGVPLVVVPAATAVTPPTLAAGVPSVARAADGVGEPPSWADLPRSCVKDLFLGPSLSGVGPASTDFQVGTGRMTKVVQVEGVSCRAAFRYLREWVESGQTDDGFELVADGDGDPDSIQFVNDEGTRSPDDDQTITVQDPLGCFLGIGCGPSGSTVRVYSANATPMTVTTTKGSGANGTLAPGAGPLTATGYVSGDPYDVGVKVTDGSANQVKIQTWSSAFDHKVEIYLNGPDGLWQVPACTWLTLNVNETESCSDDRGKFTVTRIADDTSYSTSRYQYKFTVNFSAQPSGSTVNLTNGWRDPNYVSVLTGSGTSAALPTGSTLTSTGYVRGNPTDVQLCYTPGPNQVAGCRNGVSVEAGSNTLDHSLSLDFNDEFKNCDFKTAKVGQAITCLSPDFGAIVTRIADDLTPHPGGSSRRYQYNVTLDWVPGAVNGGSTINMAAWAGGGAQTATGYTPGTAQDARISTQGIEVFASSSVVDHPFTVRLLEGFLWTCQWNLNVGETRTCEGAGQLIDGPFSAGTFVVTVTRIGDDVSHASPGQNASIGGRRYQYNVTVTFTPAP